MLVRTLWSHLRGYVIIRAKGRRLESFINDAVAAGVHLWRLERATPELLVARVEAADFSRLARSGRGIGVRVTALQKRGLPFTLGRARRRRAFVAGAVLFALVLYVLGQFIWIIDIRGTDDTDTAVVAEAAARAGLRPGVLRADVEREDIVHRLHQRLPGIAWAAVEIRGVLATLRVVERTEADTTLHSPGHIVAAADGIVERLIVTQGQALVAAGETVTEGQLLVSGMLPPGSELYAQRLTAGQLPYVRAEGSVWGRVWYRGYAEITLIEDEENPLTPQGIADAVRQAEAAADAAIAARIPEDAEVDERRVAVYEELDLRPATVRATVTVAVYQNLGRFSPVVVASGADGNGLKDESHGQEDGPLQRTKQ